MTTALLTLSGGTRAFAEWAQSRVKSKRGSKLLAVHAGGDNHSDHPAKLGGGGARIVCGVIK